MLEVERAFEMLTLGAYYKYSSTAFVTFRTRMAETIAYQMLLTNDMMEISHAPNPHDGMCVGGECVRVCVCECGRAFACVSIYSYVSVYLALFVCRCITLYLCVYI